LFIRKQNTVNFLNIAYSYHYLKLRVVVFCSNPVGENYGTNLDRLRKVTVWDVVIRQFLENPPTVHD